MATEGAGKETGVPRTRFTIRFPSPDAAGRDQDEEWCDVLVDGKWRRIRFHDYAEIYEIPGLYEQLFYEELECRSPRTVREVLAEAIEQSDSAPDQVRALDIGAGNGMVGEELRKLGAETVIGIDILPAAAAAAKRDRPRVYDEYHVIDLTDVPDEVDEALRSADLNCLTSVAALGFGDIPPEAFAGAYEYVGEGDLIGLSIKADFVSSADRSGFADLLSAALDDGVLEVRARRRFVHRLSAAGEPIEYVALAAEKKGDLPL